MHNRIKTIGGLLAAITLGGAAAFAQALSFDFADPKNVNNIAFKLDAPLESISGTGTAITGTVSFDPANPGATTGRIVLATNSLTVANNSMRGHMLGEQWLNAQKNSEIVFTVTELKDVRTEGNTTRANAVGTLLLAGVTKEMTVPVTITYLPGRLGERNRGANGDLLVIRSNFSVNRNDFNIRRGQNLDTVAEEIQITMSIAGAHAR
jgi:polyisoprenoid-binding protein YceI